MTFVETKLQPPRLRTSLIERERLLRALDDSSESALTLLVAPAGYGKTTAVRSWLARRDLAAAWVTLDRADNDPVRLWTYVATSLDRVREGLGRGALQRLRGVSVALEPALDELANAIVAFGRELVIVLDDLNHVTAHDCLASLDYAVQRLPANARLVVTARSEPALAIARLRAGASLTELRADQLAFTTAEIEMLLPVIAGVELGREELVTLHSRTEGWPAAVVLAGIWLRSAADPRHTVREFGGEHRFVADYLSNEVIGSLDDDLRSFLLRAAALHELSPELCDHALERSDSAAMLAELERAGLFVERLERGEWYRVHSLFAEYAVVQLAAAEPSAAAGIRQRAAHWFRGRQMPVEAVSHAVAADDYDLAAEILVEHHRALIRAGASSLLLQQVEQLPEEQLVAHPELAAAAATAAMILGGRGLEQRRFLRHAEEGLRSGEPRDLYLEAAIVMVTAASVGGDVGRAVAAGRRAVEIAEREIDELVMAALGGLARALYLAGDVDGAQRTAQRTLEHPHAAVRPPGRALALSTLVLTLVERGRLETARRHADQARAILGRVGNSRSWLGANVSVALGALHTADGNLASAEQELSSAERFYRDELPTVQHAWLLVQLARVRGRRGRLNDAVATLDTARELLGELHDGGRVDTLADEVARELEAASERARGSSVAEPPTPAELNVLELLGSELSSRQIGEQLFLSANTVRTHTRSLYRKLGVHSRAEAVARAEALGLLGRSESPR